MKLLRGVKNEGSPQTDYTRLTLTPGNPVSGCWDYKITNSKIFLFTWPSRCRHQHCITTDHVPLSLRVLRQSLMFLPSYARTNILSTVLLEDHSWMASWRVREWPMVLEGVTYHVLSRQCYESFGVHIHCGTYNKLLSVITGGKLIESYTV